MFNKRMDMYSRLRREKTSTVQKRNPQAWFLFFRKVVKIHNRMKQNRHLTTQFNAVPLSNNYNENNHFLCNFFIIEYQRGYNNQ